MSVNLLLVEDDPDLLWLYQEIFRNIDYHITHAVNGRDALGQLKTETPDIVLLDIAMPDVSGLDVLRHIRATPRLADTKVAVVTAYSHYLESNVTDMADAQALKPLEIEELLAIIARLAPEAPLN